MYDPKENYLRPVTDDLPPRNLRNIGTFRLKSLKSFHSGDPALSQPYKEQD